MDRSTFTYYSTLLWGSAPHKCQIIVEFLVYKEEKFFLLTAFSSVQFNSVAQSCPTPCNPMNCSTPGLHVHHQLPESTQIHVHRVDDAIQHLILCRPLPLLSSVFPSIRVFSNESALHIRWPKYWSFSFNISPSNEHPGLIFKIDWLDLLADRKSTRLNSSHNVISRMPSSA